MAHQAYQLLVDIFDIPPERTDPLRIPKQLELLMENIRRAIAMKRLRRPRYFYVDAPDKAWGPGTSGDTLIINSHLAAHGLQNRRALHFDLFSCELFDADLVCRMLAEAFGGRMRRHVIDRSDLG